MTKSRRYVCSLKQTKIIKNGVCVFHPPHLGRYRGWQKQQQHADEWKSTRVKSPDPSAVDFGPGKRNWLSY